MKLVPEYDAAIVCMYFGLSIYFGRTPDIDVANEIYSLEDQHGILIPSEHQNRPGITGNSTLRLDRQRLYYWLDIPPVLDTLNVGKQLAICLRTEHGLKVQLCDNTPPDSSLRKNVPTGGGKGG